jgi:hypothetical protein
MGDTDAALREAAANEQTAMACVDGPRGSRCFWCVGLRSGAVMCPAFSCSLHDCWP